MLVSVDSLAVVSELSRFLSTDKCLIIRVS
jgi:hypothetical protein